MILRLFGGCSYHICQMPSKPITAGYNLKVFTLCDLGYTYSWIFASQSNSFNGLIHQEGLTPTGSTVFHLAPSLPYSSGLHFIIYMDNYFPSQPLLIKLRELGMATWGTARVNTSAFPPESHDDTKGIPWNEVSAGPANAMGKVLAVQWQDNSAVHFLTTIHSLEERIISECKKPRISSSNGPAICHTFGPQERLNIPIPVITNDYNHYKVGVDVADQYRSYYFTQLKCLHNWPPIFFWLLNTTIINSYLILCHLASDSPYPGSSCSFCLTLAKSILFRYGQKHSRPRKSYYTRKTTNLRYSKPQNITSLPPPTSSKKDHIFIPWVGLGLGVRSVALSYRV